jgi:hypothetical protein
MTRKVLLRIRGRRWHVPVGGTASSLVISAHWKTVQRDL